MKSIEDKEKVLEKFRFLHLDEDKAITSRIMQNDRALIQTLSTELDRSICVKKVPDAWDHGDFYNEFLQYGPITCCKVSKTFKYDGNVTEVKSNHYGFVSFDNAEDAKKALEESKEKEYEVEPFQKKPKTEAIKNNLFVKNIPVAFNE